MADEKNKSEDSRDAGPDETENDEVVEAPKKASGEGKKPAPVAAKAKAAAKDEEEESDDDADDSETDDDDDDDSESDDDSETDDDDDDDDDSESDVEVSAKGERDASTRGVARALGVDSDDEDEDEAEKKEPETALNRASRRREEAMKRRAAREKGKAAASDDDDVAVAARDTDDKLPKDKNARAKELLRRRRESASGRKVQLGAGEMVQDSLARAGSASAKWFRTNIRAIGAVVVLGALGIGGFLFYNSHKEGKIGAASDDLAQAVEADRSPTQKEDKRNDEEKKADPTIVYTSDDERTGKALAAYKKVVDEHPGVGPAILAKLGMAGVELEKGQYDQALEAFTQVSTSELANADAEVKARATEGIGFCKEGKGDLDGAMQTFKELESVKGFDDLAKYHQGRLQLKKGDKDSAKQTLLDLRKKVEVPTLEGPANAFLTEAINELLSGIDPTLARRPNAVGGMRGNSMTPEEQAEAQRKAIEQLRRQLEQQQKNGDNKGLPELPMPPGGPGEDPE